MINYTKLPKVRLIFAALIAVFSSSAVTWVMAAEEKKIGETEKNVKPLKTVKDCVRLTDEAIKLIQKREGTKVFELVQSYHMGSLDKAQVLRSIAQSEAFDGVAGKATGYERLVGRQLGSSILVIRYLEKHEQGGVLWTLRFYRPRDSWQLESVQMFGRPVLEELIRLLEPEDWKNVSLGKPLGE